MLDLHVWGGAFDLPSLDPECLAIIIYLQHASLPSQWRIIPSNDPSISPANQLPALSHDGTWVSGFRLIVDYLTSHSLCKDLDQGSTPSQSADSIAYSAFLSAHAAPLLDLSLYVSAANWTATTRPAYSKLLPFPLTWTVPPLIRAEAVKRTDHLGLAELDTDFDPNGSLHLSTGREALPETFRRHLPSVATKTVKEEMTPEQAAAIRIYGLTEDCMSTLTDMLVQEESGPRFIRSQLSSVDCLAFGYLALMRDAPVPRSFLRDWMIQKAPQLSEFVDGVKTSYLQVTGELTSVRHSVESTALGVGLRTLDSSILNIPEIGGRYAEDKRLRAEKGSTSMLDGRAILLAMCVATGAALVYARQWYMALPPFGARTQVWRHLPQGSKLSEYGDLGLMMQSLGPLYTPSAEKFSSDGRIAQTDSEVD